MPKEVLIPKGRYTIAEFVRLEIEDNVSPKYVVESSLESDIELTISCVSRLLDHLVQIGLVDVDDLKTILEVPSAEEVKLVE